MQRQYVAYNRHSGFPFEWSEGLPDSPHHSFGKVPGPGMEDVQMNPKASQEVLHHRGNYLVRRQRLLPGEATPWHRDPFQRVTVVLGGDVLAVEFRDGGEPQSWNVTAGEVDWVEPSDRVHRAVNVGKEVFEEVVIFFLDRPDAEPQPEGELRERGGI